MAKYRVLYVIIALCLAFFFIYCNSYVPLMIIIVFAFVTVVSAVLSFISAKKITFSLKAVHLSQEQRDNSEAEFMVTINNRSFIPVSLIGFTAEIQDMSESGSVKNKYYTGISAYETRDIIVSVNTAHCAYIECHIDSIFICDAFGLLKHKLKAQKCSAHTTVVPSVSDYIYIKPDKPVISDDSDKYSDYHKGDDPSQVFEVREYQEGDDLRRIHRPLSTKLDTLIIKEYSKAVEDTCSVIIETGLPTDDIETAKTMQDRILSALFRLVCDLVENEKIFTVYWYSKLKNCVMLFEVRKYEDVFPIAEAYLSSPFSDKKSESLLMTADEMTTHFDKQIYYIYSSKYCDTALINSLSGYYNMTDVSNDDLY